MSPAAPVDPRQWLERFGLQAFRPGQQHVIGAVLAGEDVLCVMPTGGGKSLCYQLPAVARPGVTIVVSPLIALMQDQVAGLERRGIRAALINSSLTMGEQNDRLDDMARGAFQLVYVAPERLRNGRFLEAIQNVNVTLLAIDEAHCVSEWGHDFRPDYSRIGRFRHRYLKGVQTIALTATATPTVRRDICESLQLRAPREFITGFARPNLRFSVDTCSGDGEKDQRLLEFLGKEPAAGIIYAATRKRCEELAEKLSQQTRSRFSAYHAGLPVEQRRVIQERFMSGEIAAIVATNAFGMGVDKSNLRYVVHYNMPGSLEAYYQEAGRAGRDGAPSECKLLFSYSDRYIQEFFIENAYPTAETVRAVYEFLCAQEVDPIELTLEEIRDALRIKDLTADAIGTAESLLAKTGVLDRLDAGAGNAVLRIDSDLETLVDLLPREAKVRRKVLRAAETIVGKQRHEDVYVSLAKIVKVADLDREQVTRSLRELSRLKAFDYIPPFRGRAVHLREKDVPFEKLQIDFAELERRKAAEYEKLNAVIRLAQSASCRQLAILRYFGDPEATECGNCDRCPTTTANSGKKALPAGVDPELVAKGVRVALSGVARMHGRFGKIAIAQMLCGSQSRKLLQWKIDRLSTFGLLAGLQQKQVIDLLDAIIDAGMCRQEDVEQRRPILQMTDVGRAVMNGTAPLPASFRLSAVLARRLAACAEKVPTSESGGEPKTEQKNEPSSESVVPPTDSAVGATVPTAPHFSANPVLDAVIGSPKTAGSASAETASASLSRGIPAPSERRLEPPVAPEQQKKSSEQKSSSENESSSAPNIASDPKHAVDPNVRDEIYWSWRIADGGYSLAECCAIRRLSKNAFFDHLIQAASRGLKIQLEWFLPSDDARLLAKVAAAGDGASSRLKALLPNHISPKLFELARVIRFADADNPSSSSTPP